MEDKEVMRLKSPDCCVFKPWLNVQSATNGYNNRGMLCEYMYHTIKVTNKGIKSQGAL